jgi:hypothetical protein
MGNPQAVEPANVIADDDCPSLVDSKKVWPIDDFRLAKTLEQKL